MIKHTDKEIINFVKGITPERYQGSHSYLQINIVKNKDNEVLFEVISMYESPTLNFNIYKKYSEFFGTENIDKYDDISENGCETCDYGSKYGYAIRVWE